MIISIFSFIVERGSHEDWKLIFLRNIVVLERYNSLFSEYCNILL